MIRENYTLLIIKIPLVIQAAIHHAVITIQTSKNLLLMRVKFIHIYDQLESFFWYKIVSSSIPEWLDDVLENGELFFIKCSPLLNNSLSCESNLQSKLPCNKHNRFSKFLRKRKLKKKVKKPKTFDVIKNRNYQPNSSFGEVWVNDSNLSAY